MRIMDKLTRALIFSKYLYSDAYNKIMRSWMFTDSEKEIISKEHFISRVACQPFYFPYDSGYRFDINLITKNQLGVAHMLDVAKSVALFRDQLLDATYD